MVPEYVSNTEYVSTEDLGFKMALRIFNGDPDKGLYSVYDPRYVKLIVYDAEWDYITHGNTPKAVENVKPLSFHVCTSDDLAQFHQIREADKAEVETF